MQHHTYKGQTHKTRHTAGALGAGAHTEGTHTTGTHNGRTTGTHAPGPRAPGPAAPTPAAPVHEENNTHFSVNTRAKSSRWATEKVQQTEQDNATHARTYTDRAHPKRALATTHTATLICK